MTAPLALEQQIEALSARLRETEAECAAKDRFIAAISRELNNPLAPVLLAVEHLRSVLPNGDMARLTAAMQLLERATDGFAKRTRALLDMADLSAAAPPLPTVVLDMSALVIQAGSDAAEIARLAGCELELAVAPGLSAVANAEALEHVLGHILANAFRFGAGRPVRLSARLDVSGDPRITISDHGPGVSADKVASLFALWVSARLTGAMGGRISVDSLPGDGTHVHVSLPHAPPGSVAPAAQTLQTP
jgi:signal transduction histidine kinase